MGEGEKNRRHCEAFRLWQSIRLKRLPRYTRSDKKG